ncbi:GNAT family N-acetyltransferase [Nannocystis radixulma]|uniref:GNAT family N-acetyltransferase n=1 Tax=Nannocystis radixulma TaxID=2995305 RepID=A0ABT5BKB3_9BACT|nr:GNAT family N-acetyltransferase [Nannocystis radixulma]MDC0674547.1 GNAT family N-acetyltransferase [Nannocystis radixulma]
MTEPHVRPMQLDDAAGVARLCLPLGVTVTAAELRRRLAALQGAASQGLFVAEAGEGVIGWMHVQERPSLLTAASAELTAIAVDERARQRGVGRRLVQAAEAWARARDCAYLVLRSGASRTGAHGFYAALGYARTSSSYKFEKPLG